MHKVEKRESEKVQKLAIKLADFLKVLESKYRNDDFSDYEDWSELHAKAYDALYRAKNAMWAWID